MQAAQSQYTIFEQEIKSLREKLSILKQQDTSDPLVRNQIKNVQGQLRKKNQALAAHAPIATSKEALAPKTHSPSLSRHQLTTPTVVTQETVEPSQGFNTLGARLRGKSLSIR